MLHIVLPTVFGGGTVACLLDGFVACPLSTETILHDEVRTHYILRTTYYVSCVERCIYVSLPMAMSHVQCECSKAEEASQLAFNSF